jgi:hypothetical protein
MAMNRKPVVFSVVLIGMTGSIAAVAKHPPKPVSPFEISEIRVEQNATDGDTEVVIFAKGGDDGFRHFTVRSPDGRHIVATYSLDPTVRGQRELLFESPEPPGEAILAAYPAGTYHFKGHTHEGERFASTARLSHQLPPQTVILSPQDESTIAAGPLLIQWSAVPGVEQILLELENESTNPEQVLTFNLPSDATSFEVPAALMAPGASYQLSIGTVAANGNRVFVEVGFETQ